MQLIRLLDIRIPTAMNGNKRFLAVLITELTELMHTFDDIINTLILQHRIKYSSSSLMAGSYTLNKSIRESEGDSGTTQIE